jgi:hypothetical protein
MRHFCLAFSAGLIFLCALGAGADDLIVPDDFGSIDEAWTYALPGDTIKVKPGTYTYAATWVFTYTGTQTDITIESVDVNLDYSPGTATIECQTPGSKLIFPGPSAQGLVIKGFVTRNAGLGIYGTGPGCSSTVMDCTALDTTSNVRGFECAAMDMLLIENCTASSTNGDGFYVGGGVRANIWSCTSDYAGGNGFMLDSPATTLVEDCTATYSTLSGFYQRSMAYGTVTFRGCMSDSAGEHGFSYDGTVDIDTEDCTASYSFGRGFRAVGDGVNIASNLVYTGCLAEVSGDRGYSCSYAVDLLYEDCTSDWTVADGFRAAGILDSLAFRGCTAIDSGEEGFHVLTVDALTTQQVLCEDCHVDTTCGSWSCGFDVAGDRFSDPPSPIVSAIFTDCTSLDAGFSGFTNWGVDDLQYSNCTATGSGFMLERGSGFSCWGVVQARYEGCTSDGSLEPAFVHPEWDMYADSLVYINCTAANGGVDPDWWCDGFSTTGMDVAEFEGCTVTNCTGTGFWANGIGTSVSYTNCTVDGTLWGSGFVIGEWPLGAGERGVYPTDFEGASRGCTTNSTGWGGFESYGSSRMVYEDCTASTGPGDGFYIFNTNLAEYRNCTASGMGMAGFEVNRCVLASVDHCGVLGCGLENDWAPAGVWLFSGDDAGLDWPRAPAGATRAVLTNFVSADNGDDDTPASGVWVEGYHRDPGTNDPEDPGFDGYVACVLRDGIVANHQGRWLTNDNGTPDDPSDDYQEYVPAYGVRLVKNCFFGYGSGMRGVYPTEFEGASYSDLYNNSDGDVQNDDPPTCCYVEGDGVIHADPMFDTDYSLLAGSPCIGTGDPRDLDSLETRADMGFVDYGDDPYPAKLLREVTGARIWGFEMPALGHSEFGIPFTPTGSANPNDMITKNGQPYNVNNRVYMWDSVKKTFLLFPLDFTTLVVGQGYLYLNYFGARADQLDIEYAGVPVPVVGQVAIPEEGRSMIAIPNGQSLWQGHILVRNNATGEIRTAVQDRQAAEHWLNWNWVYWDFARSTYDIVGLGNDDEMVQPWYSYQLWAYQRDLTLFFPGA